MNLFSKSVRVAIFSIFLGCLSGAAFASGQAVKVKPVCECDFTWRETREQSEPPFWGNPDSDNFHRAILEAENQIATLNLPVPSKDGMCELYVKKIADIPIGDESLGGSKKRGTITSCRYMFVEESQTVVNDFKILDWRIASKTERRENHFRRLISSRSLGQKRSRVSTFNLWKIQP